MKKKILVLAMLLAVFSFKSYGAELTQTKNGADGEIIVKYDNQESPLVLIEGKDMSLSITIEKTKALTDPKMFIAIYENSSVKNIFIADGVDLGTKYQFQKTVHLPDNLTNCFAKVFLWEKEVVPTLNDLKFVTVLHPIFYKYNAKNQIETIKYFDKTITYIYDDNGNLVSKNTISNSSTQTIATALDLSTPISQIPVNTETTTQSETPAQAINSAVLNAVVSVGEIDGVQTTIYNLSLFDENDFISD